MGFSEDKSKQFFDSAKDGNLEGVEALSVDPEVNLNWKDHSGWSPFLFACVRGHVAIVRYLLGFRERPIDVNVVTAEGNSPFNRACFSGNEKVVELLLGDERIDVNKVNKDEKTPLWLASCEGRLSTVKLLLASGRRIETSVRDTRDRKTASEIARSRGKTEVAMLLESFEKDPQKVRAQLRKELKFPLEVPVLLPPISNSPPPPAASPPPPAAVNPPPAASPPPTPEQSKSAELGLKTLHPVEVLIDTNAIPPSTKDQEELEKLRKLVQDLRSEAEGFQRQLASSSREAGDLRESLEKERKSSQLQSAALQSEIAKLSKEKEASLVLLTQKASEIDVLQKELQTFKRPLSGIRRFRVRYGDHLAKIEIKLPIETPGEIKQVVSEVMAVPSSLLLLKYQDPADNEFYMLTSIADLPQDCTMLQATTTTSQSSLNADSTLPDIVNPTYWNLRPNPTETWETRRGAALVYQRLLLRSEGKNVLLGTHDLIRKLTFLMNDRFGLPMDNVTRAYALYNEHLAQGFESRWRTTYTEHRNSPDLFKKSEWIEKSADDIALQKFKFLHHYTKMAQSFNWNYVAPYVVPMIHGTTEAVAEHICQSGLSIVGTTDPGYFGKGMYFTNSHFYASRYAKPDANGVRVFVICLVLPGNVYPVTEPPKISDDSGSEFVNPDGFLGKPIKTGYQSHFTLVKKTEFKKAYPIVGKIDSTTIASELVVLEKAQVLPLFLVYTKA